MRPNRLRLMSALLAAGLPLLAGCESEIDNKPAATVAEAPGAAASTPATQKKASPPPAPPSPVKVGATTAAVVPDGAWALAPSSEIHWVGAKVTKDHPGGFKVVKGHAVVADGKIASGTVIIDLTSLFSDHPKLEKHLRSPDFFGVETYPTATFTLTEVGADSVTGTLDLHGVKKEIGFPATVTVSEAKASIQAEFTLMRKDFGITYPGKPEDLIRDEVLVKGTLAFVR